MLLCVPLRESASVTSTVVFLLGSAFAGEASVSEVARRHGLRPQQLFGWRHYGPERTIGGQQRGPAGICSDWSLSSSLGCVVPLRKKPSRPKAGWPVIQPAIKTGPRPSFDSSSGFCFPTSAFADDAAGFSTDPCGSVALGKIPQSWWTS
jgi:hypothetical protein